eukprot:TRINITY_DN2292_c0_g2_i1.p1 TRINITY_DN2292_c0_g2~~TRINITY_DN2292_c0_g2_i1.p1  ORF type:complete len:283 (+),score=18.65 TRINITY_DN2292_c0_g2_i1:62-850(+)
MKRARTLRFEKQYLSKLPCAEMYERSYMHRDVLTHTAVSKKDYIVTGSVDGHIKFWKKTPVGIEFVKHFRAHLGSIHGFALSHDGDHLATTSSDKHLKIFDVASFDMINMIELSFEPGTCEWIFRKSSGKFLIACADLNSPTIHLYSRNPEMVDDKPVASATISLHTSPVKIIKFNPTFGVCVSVDSLGVIEYWDVTDLSFPSAVAKFSFKSETDLFVFAQDSVTVKSLEFSPSGKLFATMSSDRIVRVLSLIHISEPTRPY